MICTHVLARSAYSESARDRQICAGRCLTRPATSPAPTIHGNCGVTDPADHREPPDRPRPTRSWRLGVEPGYPIVAAEPLVVPLGAALVPLIPLLQATHSGKLPGPLHPDPGTEQLWPPDEREVIYLGAGVDQSVQSGRRRRRGVLRHLDADGRQTQLVASCCGRPDDDGRTRNGPSLDTSVRRWAAVDDKAVATDAEAAFVVRVLCGTPVDFDCSPTAVVFYCLTN